MKNGDRSIHQKTHGETRAAGILLRTLSQPSFAKNIKTGRTNAANQDKK